MSVFGPLVSRSTIERAVLATLSDPPVDGGAPRILYYLAEVERQTGLTPRTLPPPPGPSSYRGEIDDMTLQAEWLPLIGVVAEPTGRPERHEGGEYGQWYQLQIAAIVGDDDEDQARMIADAYGIAIAAAVLQRGSLGGVAVKTVMAGSPEVKYLTPDTRQVAQATVTVQSYIQPVLIDRGGPPVWPADPYLTPADYPQVETVNVELDATTELP